MNSMRTKRYPVRLNFRVRRTKDGIGLGVAYNDQRCSRLLS